MKKSSPEADEPEQVASPKAGGPEKLALPKVQQKTTKVSPRKNQAVVARIKRNPKTTENQKHNLMVTAMTKKGMNLGVGDLVGMYEHVENLKKDVPVEKVKQESEAASPDQLPPQVKGVVKFKQAIETMYQR